MSVTDRLKELSITLPPPPPRGGVYKPIVQVGNLLYVSGQGATLEGVPVITGKLGADCTVEAGQQAARMCTLNALSLLETYLGSLDRIKRVVKLLAFVASAEGFGQQPLVANGASCLLESIWGDDGIGARSAIGVNELPGNIVVEIEFIFEI